MYYFHVENKQIVMLLSQVSQDHILRVDRYCILHRNLTLLADTYCRYELDTHQAIRHTFTSYSIDVNEVEGSLHSETIYGITSLIAGTSFSLGIFKIQSWELR